MPVNKLNIGALSTDEKTTTLKQWFKTWLFEYKVNEIRLSTLENMKDYTEIILKIAIY